MSDVGSKLLLTAVFSGKTSNGVMPYVLAFVRRRRSVVCQKVSGSNISRRACPRITKCYTVSMPTYNLEPRGYDDISCYAGRHLWRFEKTVQNAASDGFGSIFSGAAFCLPPPPIGGLLVLFIIIRAM